MRCSDCSLKRNCSVRFGVRLFRDFKKQFNIQKKKVFWEFCRAGGNGGCTRRCLSWRGAWSEKRRSTSGGTISQLIRHLPPPIERKRLGTNFFLSRSNLEYMCTKRVLEGIKNIQAPSLSPG